MFESFSSFLYLVAWTPDLDFSYDLLLLPNALLKEIPYEKDKCIFIE